MHILLDKIIDRATLDVTLDAHLVADLHGDHFRRAQQKLQTLLHEGHILRSDVAEVCRALLFTACLPAALLTLDYLLRGAAASAALGRTVAAAARPSLRSHRAGPSARVCAVVLFGAHCR